FGQIDHRAFRRLRGLGSAEMHLLACRTTPCVGNLKITVAYAEVGLSVLRPRRGAVNRRRSRMHVDHLGVEWTVHHLSALPGIKAKPSSGGDIRTLFQADRRFNAEACAVAHSKFRARLRNRRSGD